MAYNSAYTGSQVDTAVGAVRQKETKWDNKQDELTGTEDQLVGFNSAGEAVAVAKPTAADVGAMPAVTGGTTGQVLTKTEAGQEWQNAPDGFPEGGTDGQILTKTADGVAWEDAPEGGVTSFNSRTGAITPQAGDYTAEMVGALPIQTGTQGQVLGFTADNTVGAMDAPSGLPTGGTPGQMLYQGESGPEWGDKPVMYVNITEISGGYSADKTVAEIQEAVEAGYSVIANINGMAFAPFFTIQSGVVVFATGISYGKYIDVMYKDPSAVVAHELIVPSEASDLSFNKGTTGLTADNVQDAIEEVNEKIPSAPKSVSVTLPASGWSSNTQTVTVQGVKTSGQSVRISPATKTDADNWVAAGVWCSEPTTANQLVFTCDTAPTENININVELQEVQS